LLMFTVNKLFVEQILRVLCFVIHSPTTKWKRMVLLMYMLVLVSIVLFERIRHR